ncbi:hypothetical protein J4E91_004777 [Alternaria rosae]|nr:hypothetical protein J4E91_004777 [Alternaria rosae]
MANLPVCKDFTRATLTELSPKEKEYLTQTIRESVMKEGLPPVDDEGIEWRVSKILPELRHYQRYQYEAWERAAQRPFPFKVLREAVDANMEKIPKKGLRYWTDIPEEVRMNLAEDVNRRLDESDLPMMDEEAVLYRLRKHVNHWIRDHYVSQ